MGEWGRSGCDGGVGEEWVWWESGGRSGCDGRVGVVGEE